MTKTEQSLLESLLNDSSFRNWANRSNQNDMEYWESWVSKNPEKVETVYTAKSIITGIAFNTTRLPEGKITMELNAVLSQIKTKKDSKVISLKRKTPTQFQKYAAIAAVSILFVVLGNMSYNSSSEVTHKTGFGEIIDLKLPDGTSVVLNGNSEISYDKGNSRDITLKGEAYFKVNSIPSTKAKFWVTTRDLKVEVYGTQFHVNTRKQKTDVLLDEGSIHLLLENGTTKKMIPGELVSFSKDDNKVTHEKVTKELSYSIWREGTYVFNNISLEEVMTNVEQAYGLKVEFIDENLKQRLLTGGIPNQNLKICLSAIEKSTGTRIVKKGNRLILLKTE
jgi:ferric-dicitrate binding protein FerR (iron transport regulator)